MKSCIIDRLFLIHPRISRINRKQMFTHLIMNGTSKINSAASISNTRTLGRRLPPNLKTKSKCAIKQHSRNKRVIRVITRTGMPSKNHVTNALLSAKIKFARDNQVWEMRYLNHSVWVIEQVWGQDGWIVAKFFFCVFMDRDEVEVHKHAKKKNEANIQPSWPNKLGQ